MNVRPVRLGEPLRFRAEVGLRKALRQHAQRLSSAAGKPLGISAAIRDALNRGLAERVTKADDAAFGSGFRVGFLAAHAEIKSRLAQALGGGKLAESEEAAANEPISPAAATESDKNDARQQGALVVDLKDHKGS